MDRTYSITDISKRTGLSLDTIRYYEKLKLVPAPERNNSGQRVYSQTDMDRYIFISLLKKTDMPLKKIQVYMENSVNKNYDNCYDLLDEHKTHIETEISEMLSTLDILKYKLKHFEELKSGAFIKHD